MYEQLKKLQTIKEIGNEDNKDKLIDIIAKEYNDQFICDLGVINFLDLHPVEIFNVFVYSVSRSCREDFGWEDWIRYLLSELRRYKFFSNNFHVDPGNLEFVNICMALCLFFLQDYNEIPPYIKKGSKNKEIQLHLKLVKDFIKKDVLCPIPNPKPKPNVLVLVSISVINDRKYFKHTLNIEKYKYRRINHTVRTTNSFKNLIELFDEIKKYDQIIFVGHGNDLKDTVDIYTKEDAIPLNISDLNILFKRTDKIFEFVAFLNCSHKSFLPLQMFSEISVFPTASNNYLIESIVKTYLDFFDRYLDLRLAINYSLYSTIFKFDESLTFNVYPEK